MSEQHFMTFFSRVICILLLASCANEAVNSDDRTVADEGLIPDYRVWGEEGNEEVTVRLQYFSAGTNGEAVALQHPANVLLDGVELAADSARLNGAYYEVTMPVDSFKGNHTIVYVDEHNREHHEKFGFEPFTLAAALPENVAKKPFELQLKGIPDTATFIRLVLVDTSLGSADVNEELLIVGGKIAVTEDYLANLTRGPVIMEIYREEERPLRSATFKHGRFAMTYGLKRQFNLIK